MIERERATFTKPGFAGVTDERKDVHNSDIPLICRACEARHKGVCGALPPEHLLELSKSASRHTVDASTELLEEHQPVEQYANIMSGVVKLSKLLEDGRQQIVGLQFAPDFLGRPFEDLSNVTAVATTPVSLCTFPKTALERIANTTPEIGMRLYKQTRRELNEAQDWLLALGRKSATERVASLLLYIGEHVDPERELAVNQASFEIPLTRSEIADFLGLTIETVSRQITKLRNAKLIEIEDNRHITIPDVARLSEYAGL